MAILTISKLLKEAGLDTTKRIKLVRHKDGRKTQLVNGCERKGNPYDWYVNDRDTFIAYQSEQSEEVFKGVDYISSAGLRVLLTAQKKMNAQGHMELVNVNEAVMDIFEMTGFADILEIK